jgi:UDP-N-acetylglucosamine--N-acetylmuramyl-(pentapeptide) pyrophosphoryl-undecaprenol N-acetylglucosamine transferase
MHMGLKLVVACGGTGGHAFPGLAVARELLMRGHDLTVWMSGRDVESSVLKDWDGPVFATGARQMSLKNIFANMFAVLRCRKQIRRSKIDAILAMGSYSSLPPVLAAAGCKVPVVLHEANTVPGRAVDFLSFFAKAIAVSFEETAGHFSKKETVLTGLPVRTDIVGKPRFAEVPED